MGRCLEGGFGKLSKTLKMHTMLTRKFSFVRDFEGIFQFVFVSRGHRFTTFSFSPLPALFYQPKSMRYS